MAIDKTKLESTEEDFFGFNDSHQLRSQKVFGESHVKLDGMMETPKEHRESSGEDKEKKKAAKEFYDYILWLNDYISDFQANILASTKALKAIDMLRDLYDRGDLDVTNKSHQKLLEDADLTYDEVMTGGDAVFDKKEKFWNDRLEQNVNAYKEAQNLQEELGVPSNNSNFDITVYLELNSNPNAAIASNELARDMYLANSENSANSLVAEADDYEDFFGGTSVASKIDEKPIFENTPAIGKHFAAARDNEVTVQVTEPKVIIQPTSKIGFDIN